MRFSIKNSMRWSIFIFFATFILAALFTVVTTTLLEGSSWQIGIIVVFLLILVGIVFDILGIAATAANETPFHAMAAKKIKGARQSINIIRNADRFSNFCHDMIGDITGIISGGAAAIVVIGMLANADVSVLMRTIISVVFTALVSSVTVSGKAVGKSFAFHYSSQIVLLIGKLFYIIESRFGIRLFAKKKQKSQGKRGNKRDA